MLEFFFSIACPYFFFDKKITTLDQWQKASHVAIVEVEKIIHFPPPYKKGYEYNSSYRALPLWKLKIIEMLTDKKPDTKTIYTSFNLLPSLKEKDRVLLAFGNFITYSSRHSKTKAYLSLYLLNRETGEKPLYGHPYYHEWPLFKNKEEKYYLPDCVDGLTKMPLVNPLLSEIKSLTKGVIDKEPNTRIVKGLWPSYEQSKIKACKCKDKKYNPL
ncbi:MAG: hypothetical protein OXC37_04790 [Bdellovibrionaceae bacterium]|nr:hypothetical protein [Pseudobdellovibrionaceae bacterium]